MIISRFAVLRKVSTADGFSIASKHLFEIVTHITWYGCVFETG